MVSGTKPRGSAWIALASLLWSTDTFFRKPLTDQGIASTAIAFFEHIFSAVVSLPLAWRQLPIVKTFDRRDWISLLFIGAGGSALGLVLFTQSFVYGNPTVSILMQKLQPVIAVILASVILGEGITKRFAVMGAVAFLASYFLAFGDATYGAPLVDLLQPGTWLTPMGSLDSAAAAAATLALGAAFFWGGSTVFGRRLAARYEYHVVTSLRLLVGLAFLAIIITVTMPPLPFHELPRLLFLGTIIGYLPLYLYYRGLRATKAQVATFAELVWPLSAVTINWIVLGLALTATQIIAAAVLIATIAFMSKERVKQPLSARPGSPASEVLA